MIRVAGLVLVFFLGAVSPLRSQDTAQAATPAPQQVSGAEDPAFRTALDHWLADDEESALPALDVLAEKGNTAAQILLALIDKSPELQGPWLSSLPREQRVTMMRDQGGLSGQSWIHKAAKASPLAETWQSLWKTDASFGVLRSFAQLGEPRAGRAAAVTLAGRARTGFADLAEDPAYPDGLRYFIWREWAGRPDHLPRLTDEFLALGPGDPQRAMMGQDVPAADYARWLMTAPEARPIAALCDLRCTETAPSCALAAARALGDPSQVMVLGTPAEALIPTESFVQSPRGQAALLRRVLLGASIRMRPAMFARAAETDSCFAEILAEEAGRY